jgi:indolepyruvate ferredoxin oxidoreductase beta subunit
VLLASEQRITPAPLGNLSVDYPPNPRALCEVRVARCVFIPALDLAREIGEEKAANMVILGAYSTLEPDIDETLWQDTIGGAFRPEFRDINVRAFVLGRERTSAQAPDGP